MAKTAAIKVSVDIEYVVLGNFLGVLIASGGLLAGTMVREGSTAYWPEDLVPLLLVAFMGIRLVRSFIKALLIDHVPRRAQQHHPSPQGRQSVTPEAVAMAQLPPVPGYTPDQVLEAVAKRIENNKAKASGKAPK